MTCATETMTCTIDSDLRVRTDSCTEVTSSELYDQGQLKLAHTWSIWYDRGFQKGRIMGANEYQSDLQLVGSFNCISDFWRYWNALDLKMPKGANLRIFKDGIMPTWEDPLNGQGGRWTLASCENKGKHTEQDTTNILEILLWLVGCGSSVQSDRFCGMVFSRRTQGTVLSVWNTDANDAACVKTVTAELFEIVGSQFKYKKHYKTNGSAPPSPQVKARKSPASFASKSPSKSLDKSKSGKTSSKTQATGNSGISVPKPRSKKNSNLSKHQRDLEKEADSSQVDWRSAAAVLLGATVTGVLVSVVANADWIFQ